MAVVLDSDAVIGFLDSSDALHEAAASAMRDLTHERRLLVSAVTYAEVLTGTRLGHHDQSLVREFFADMISEILPVDAAVAEAAAELRSRLRSMRMPDALILATAEITPEVDLLLTGDRQIGRVKGLDCQVRILG